MKIYHLILIGMVLMTSCEIYSEALEYPDYQPGLIVNGVLSTVEGLWVHLAHNQPADGELYDSIDYSQFQVILWSGEKDKQYAGVQKEGYFYIDPDSLVFDSTTLYWIEVIDENGEVKLSSNQCLIPAPPNIRSLAFVQDSTTFPPNNYIELQLLDAQSSPSGYIHHKVYSIDGGQSFYSDPINYQNPRFRLTDAIESDNYSADIIDVVLNAKTFIRPPGYEVNQEVNAVLLTISRMDTHLLQFYQTVSSYRDTESSPFTVTNPVYSNIQGGQGVFGVLHSVDTVLFLDF